MRSSYTYRLLALALFLLSAPRALADQISWSYDFSMSPSTVQASSGGSGQVDFTTLSGSMTSTLPTAATLTAVNLHAVSAAAAANPARFNDAEYTLTMHFTDLSSGLKATVTFEGVLNGTVSASGTSLKNTFLGQTEYAFDLNHHVYDISIGDFRAPGAHGSDDLGSISVEVSLHHNPEPSSLVLGALALPALAYLRRRR